MTRPTGVATALAVVGALALLPGVGSAQLPAFPQVQFCILPAAYLEAGERHLRDMLAHDSAFAEQVAERLYAAGQAPRPLPASECQELASVWVERGRIGPSPTAIFALGSGFVVYQPTPEDRGGSFALISPSLELVGGRVWAAFE